MFRPKSGKRKDRDCVLSRNAYCMYERDLVPISLKMIENLADAFGVLPAWLAFGIGEPKTKNAKSPRLKSRHGPGRRMNGGSNSGSIAAGA